MRNRYQPAVPRMGLRLTAAAMTAMTMWVLVVLPARLAAADAPGNELAQVPRVPGLDCAASAGNDFLRTLLAADGTHAVDVKACPARTPARLNET